ncbi:MAG: GAF domain-containing protein [Epsilonproteobacteria bacterium]|nr:GAF domain-containing protein [Campylobacterota bacterium]
MKNEETYAKLADFGRELLNKKSLVDGLPHIASYAREIIGAQRCSIFIYDNQRSELWTTIADGVEKIIVPSNKGIVGYTLKVKKPLIVNDAYADPNFLSDVDLKTGYKTENLVTAPIFDSNRQIVGVLELLNKKDGFDNEDVKFMIFFAHYISGFIELTNIYKG